MTDLIDFKYTAFRHIWADVWNAINAFASLSGSNVTRRIDNVKQAFSDLQSTGVVLFDPVIGELETEVHLPMGVDSLKSLPNVNLTHYFTGLTSMMGSVREATSILQDFFEVDVRSFIPPFTASASISNGLVKTFDGTTYTIGGKCDYLLVGDLTDGNFIVYMENQGKQRVKIVLTTHQHTVQISPRKQVRIDGALVILPYRSHDVYVTKIGGTIILTGSGFSLQHNSKTESYHFSLSGWYHGKTGGLFGTYDNEPYNDLMASTGKISRNITEFSKTWKLNEQCT
ncbi:Apolipophorin [Mizuhopecten yessoensis]|uniref:Apolipophorin n=2 Tax=Mizuhopecten yessoensis TaxID=6573 RepID=A0A210R2I2_MIZYE|nr:Apolipophorin [Mizuhopecten yessoensis]